MNELLLAFMMDRFCFRSFLLRSLKHKIIKMTKRTGIEYRQIKTANGSLPDSSGMGYGFGEGLGGIYYSLQTPETQ